MNTLRHVAIIMDGNGRWAKEQGKPRSFGHYQGTENVRNIAIKANQMGIEVLTVYAFSTENWKRPQEEVDYLMSVPAIFFKKFLKELMDEGIRVCSIGDLSAFPDATRKIFEEAIETTKNNTNMSLVFAVNYGGRQDIVNACNQFMAENPGQKADETSFARYLSTAQFPEVDLMIRTSLDYRISNFLLWQLSYAEMYFTDTYWPAFTAEEFEKACSNFETRHRRFGGL